jgi:hypothetical protein
VEEVSGKHQFTVNPPNPYRMFDFRGYVTGLDTIPVVSDIGVTLSFLKSSLLNKRISDCYIPQETYQNDMLEAFNFMCGRFGPPQGVFQVFVSPHGSKTMPGLMEAPQIVCVNAGQMEAYGGFKAVAGLAAAKQWFGALLQPATDREFWLAEALPQYASLLYLEKTLGSAFYANLTTRKDSVMQQGRMYKQMPLAAGLRCHETIRSNKGLWILHMLRNMMRDLNSNSDRTFLKFLRSAMAQCSAKPFTNADIIQLASKHYGESLDMFFHYWLYGGRYPEFDTRYAIKQEGDGFYAEVTVAAKNVGNDFVMPIVMGIVDQDGNATFQRQMINGTNTSFKMGPFTGEPSKIVFNEFNSILSDDYVKKE